MTGEEIQTNYEQGPETVKALVQELLSRIAQQEQLIAALTNRVKSLD